MNSYELAESIVISQIEEIVANCSIRKHFTALFVGKAADLYKFEEMRGDIRIELSRALKLSKFDESSAYRGAVIQLNSTFEAFIKSLFKARMIDIQEKFEKFSSIDKNIRNSYIHHAGGILTKIHDGKINGVNFDFEAFREDLGGSLFDQPNHKINPDVFTLFLGNCTPERIRKLFELCSLGDPFEDAIAKNPKIKKWAGEGKARDTLKLVKAGLEEVISLRNDIAHGNVTKQVLFQDVERYSELFLALVDAFTIKAKPTKVNRQ